MRVLVAIPTYNEAENIGRLLPKVFEVFRKEKLDGSALVIDDSSTDGTSELVKKLSKKYRISLLSRKEKTGLGSAYLDGFRKVLPDKPDVIFTMDADLSHDPDYIPKFLKKLGEGFDVVVGSRYMPGGECRNWPLIRRILSKGANLLFGLIAGLDISDVTSGYRAYRREVIEKIGPDNVRSTGYEYQLEMLHRAAGHGFKIGTVPIVFYQRKRGESKLGGSDIRGFLVRSLQLRLGICR